MSTITTATEISGGGGGGGPTGAAGGDLGGTYPNPTVDDDSHAHTSATVTPAGIGAAPASVDYLVGTASGGLSAEIAVGTTPGGELGGTWASPTVDATHSGSAHHTRSHDHSNASDGTALSPASVHAAADVIADLIVQSNNGDIEGIYNANNNGAAGVYLSKSRNPTPGAHTTVQDDDDVAEFVGYASDGAAFRKAGRMVLQVDGTPGASDMPGRWVWETTPPGSATPVQHMVLDSAGVLDATTIKQGGTAVSLSGHSHSTDFGENADISTQAMGDAPSAGSTGEVADAGHKHGMPSFGGSAAAVGTSAAGVATTPSRSDHVHATGAGTPAAVSTANAIGSGPAAAMTDHVHAHEAAHLAHDTLWDAAGDLVVGSGADTAAKLGLTVPAANILNVLGVVNGETTPTWKSVHDATAPAAIGTAAAGTALTAAHRDHVHATGAGTPSTQAFGDAAATGSGPAAAMTDHKHAMMANPVTGHEVTYDHTLLHARSHNHSAAGDGTSLSPATMILPARTSSYPTTLGDAIYHSTLGALIVGSGGGQSFIMPISGNVPGTQAFGDAGTAGTADSTPHSDHKHPMPTLGYGLSGNSAPAVGLTNSTALATAETSISAATYADVTGVSLSLAAGTWLLIADVYGRIVNARAQMNAAITDGSNNIVREGTADIPASGTASVNSSAHVGLHAIVSPGSTTTYKLRAARGNTTNTGTWTAMDGAATGTANNASDNTDKATGLIAIRLA